MVGKVTRDTHRLLWLFGEKHKNKFSILKGLMKLLWFQQKEKESLVVSIMRFTWRLL